MRFELADEAATIRLGARLARALPRGSDEAFLVTLEGPLGAGKTSLVRAVLRALGHAGAVRSPTYTLLEPYEETDPPVTHLDLYRLSDPDELDFLGFADQLAAGNVLFVEWPERAAPHLPAADLAVALSYAGTGRSGTLRAGSPAGERVLRLLGAAST